MSTGNSQSSEKTYSPNEAEYSEMVKSLAKSGDAILVEMAPYQAHIMHMTLGIAGEAGELVDAVKKHIIYGRPLDVENVIEELGDLEWYMEGLRQAIDTTRQEIIDHNWKKLSKRYKDFQYSDAQAHARADKSEKSF